MEAITPVKLGIAEKLRSKGYFRSFFRERAKDEISIQIRELRNRRGYTQKQFAKISNMKQSAVSRIEQAEYSGWSFKTLLKVAESLDARLRVVFQPMEEVIAEYERRERREAGTGLMGADIGSLPQHPRAFQGITAPGQMLKKQQLLLESLGAVPMHGVMTLEEAGAFVASDASQVRARADTSIFGHQSDETDSNTAFAGRQNNRLRE